MRAGSKMRRWLVQQKPHPSLRERVGHPATLHFHGVSRAQRPYKDTPVGGVVERVSEPRLVFPEAASGTLRA